MPKSDDLVVRLIVWQGKRKLTPKQLKEKDNYLKTSITQHLKSTKWRYQVWKMYEEENTGTHKLEIRFCHPRVEDAEKSNVIHKLCHYLLSSDLASELRMLTPGTQFVFCPSREGTISFIDRVFARVFSATVVTRFCIKDDAMSKELENMKDEFLKRNSTKYLYQPMVGLLTVASYTERYTASICKIVSGIEMLCGGSNVKVELGKKVSSAVFEKTYQTLGLKTNHKIPDDLAGIELKKIPEETPHILKSPEENAQALKLSIAIACWTIRGFVAMSPHIKEAIKPKLLELNEVVIRGRLTLANRSYLIASRAPIIALEYLHQINAPNADDLAMTINAFGSLMQTTLPFFDATLAITDAEFASVSTLAIGAGASLLTMGGASLWYLTAGAAITGPIGLMAAAGAATVALGATAVIEGVKWSRKQQTNPSIVLLDIQKTLEECSRFLLGLLFILAEEDKDNSEDKSHLDAVQHLKEQLNSDLFTKPGYKKAYFKNVSIKLAKDMEDLAVGIEKYGVKAALKSD